MNPHTVHLLGTVALVLAACGIAVAALWGGFALGYRSRGSVAQRTLAVACWGAFGVAMLAVLGLGHGALGLAGFAVGLAALIRWWSRLRPADDGDWADDVARPTTGTIDGNRVTLQNVRNFDWRSTDDYTPRWETRGYDLDGVGSVDMIMSYWRGPSIAHMLVSFGFGDRSQVVFSVEVRRRKSQQFSEIAGFFKEFELCIIAADELDIVHLRTNVRGERVYLYRLLLSRPAMRELFMGYVAEANRLHRAPRFYNTLTVNCTTLVYQMLNRIVGGLPLSYRLLYSGYMPEYMYGVGRLDGRHSLQELRDRGFVTERARQSGRSPTFSADIRKGVPGTDGAACGPLAP
jgi:hypothetical protein